MGLANINVYEGLRIFQAHSYGIFMPEMVQYQADKKREKICVESQVKFAGTENRPI